MSQEAHTLSTQAEVLANLTNIRRMMEQAAYVKAGQTIEEDDINSAKLNPSMQKAIKIIATCVHTRNIGRAIAMQAKAMIEPCKQRAEALMEDDQLQAQAKIYRDAEQSAATITKDVSTLTSSIKSIDEEATNYALQAIAQTLEQQQDNWLPTVLKAIPTLSDDHKAVLTELAGSFDHRPIIDQLQERSIDMPDEQSYWVLLATLALALSKGVL